MDVLLELLKLSTILWEYVLLFGLVGLGIYLTVRLKIPTI